MPFKSLGTGGALSEKLQRRQESGSTRLTMPAMQQTRLFTTKIRC